MAGEFGHASSRAGSGYFGLGNEDIVIRSDRFHWSSWSAVEGRALMSSFNRPRALAGFAAQWRAVPRDYFFMQLCCIFMELCVLRPVSRWCNVWGNT